MSASSGSGRAPVKGGECPTVADLLDHAWGMASPDESRRIENHLRSGDCRDCQRWVEQARRMDKPPSAAYPSPANPHQANPSEWQQQAFANLEERLRGLEES